MRYRDSGGSAQSIRNTDAAWLEALPTSLQDTATAEALQAICDLDLADLQAIDPPRGFGRD